jgi:transposase
VGGRWPEHVRLLALHARCPVVDLLGVMMILDLHKQGLSVSAIAKRLGLDRKTVRKYIERGGVAPQYAARPAKPSLIAPFESYLRERLAA